MKNSNILQFGPERLSGRLTATGEANWRELRRNPIHLTHRTIYAPDILNRGGPIIYSPRSPLATDFLYRLSSIAIAADLITYYVFFKYRERGDTPGRPSFIYIIHMSTVTLKHYAGFTHFGMFSLRPIFSFERKIFCWKKNEIKNFYDFNRMQCCFLKNLTF